MNQKMKSAVTILIIDLLGYYFKLVIFYRTVVNYFDLNDFFLKRYIFSKAIIKKLKTEANTVPMKWFFKNFFRMCHVLNFEFTGWE